MGKPILAHFLSSIHPIPPFGTLLYVGLICEFVGTEMDARGTDVHLPLTQSFPLTKSSVKYPLIPQEQAQ